MDKSWSDVREVRKLLGKKKCIATKKSKTPSKIRKSNKFKKYILKLRSEVKNQLAKLFESKLMYII